MAKGSNQKSKLLYLSKIFHEKTDENNGITVQDLIEELKKYNISADRKTIYSDLDELKDFGYDIVSYKEGHSNMHALVSREFELPELKLLVDSVQSSKFITTKKSRELIKKLESLVSVNEGKELHRQVLLSGRIKSMNESVYYNVDKIHNAINNNKQISFQYFRWNEKKKMELRHDGKIYNISPWTLLWEDENYYLIGYDDNQKIIKHFRVDKMINLNVLNEKRLGKEIFSSLDLPNYPKKLFGMFGGEIKDVTLLCENSLAGAIIDRFGKDLIFINADDNHFRVNVKVAMSRQFLGWVFGFGGGITIVGPSEAVEEMKTQLKKILGNYK